MMARFGMKWGVALVSLMLLGGCLQEDPAGPDTKNGKDLLTKGGDSTGNGLVCTAEFAPVCGADGKTYGNQCMASVAKVDVAKEGACGDVVPVPIKPDPIKPIDPGEGWACAAVWDPVCGKDGKTYGNSCEARLVEIAYKGECK